MKKYIILTTVFTILTIFVFAQNFENTKKKLEDPEHGQYHPAQYKQGYPYTTFYKPLDNNYIENIRIKITGKKTREYFQPIYKEQIYPDAQKTYSSNDLTGENKGVAPNSYYAKHAAFVYLMGFDKEGEYLRGSQDVTKIQELYAFRTIALKRLINIDYEVSAGNNIQYRVKEMVHYLQAYDLLKTAEMLADKGVQGYSFSQSEKEQLEVIKFMYI